MAADIHLYLYIVIYYAALFCKLCYASGQLVAGERYRYPHAGKGSFEPVIVFLKELRPASAQPDDFIYRRKAQAAFCHIGFEAFYHGFDSISYTPKRDLVIVEHQIYLPVTVQLIDISHFDTGFSCCLHKAVRHLVPDFQAPGITILPLCDHFCMCVQSEYYVYT